MKYFDWEDVDNGQKSITLIGNNNVYNHFKCTCQQYGMSYIGKLYVHRYNTIVRK